MHQIACRILIALGAAPTLVFAGKGLAAGAVRSLAMPAASHSLETLSRDVRAVAVQDGRLVALPAGEAFVMLTPFHPGGKTRLATFGKITDSTRAPLVSAGEPFRWAGLFLDTNKALLLEGERLTLFEEDPKTWKEVLRRTVAWDLILPPRDRGGEATRPEIQALRARFKKAFKATAGSRVTGMVRLPFAEGKALAGNYLLATRVKGFPLVLMRCDRQAISQCLVLRQCDVPRIKDLSASGISGVGVSAKRHEVLLMDATKRRILRFAYSSCSSLRFKGELRLPAKLKRPANLTVDTADRLWVATEVPDDYLNASLYYWDAASW